MCIINQRLLEQAYSEEIGKLFLGLKTTPDQGLKLSEVKHRIDVYGKNELKVATSHAWYNLLVRQFTNLFILILLIASFLAYFIGEWGDSVAILAIILLNGILGFVQEWKSEAALAGLAKLLSPTSHVLREGEPQEIKACDLVYGDVVLLNAGDVVPADVRLFETVNLKMNEACITGEADDVAKSTEVVDVAADLSQRRSMAWMGTTVLNGHGKGVVTGVGFQSEFGKIAQLSKTIKERPSPLQVKLGELAKRILILAVFSSLFIVVVGWLHGKAFAQIVLEGISLAVAVIPEGLPAVVTITLAIGTKTLVKKKALLRNLQAAEGLSASSVICIDKTGTLTKNEMMVQRLWVFSDAVEITGSGYDPKGQFLSEGVVIGPLLNKDISQLIEVGLRCNGTQLVQDENAWRVIGDSTEAALLVLAKKAGLTALPPLTTVSEISFSSERKCMSVVMRDDASHMLFTKGAPEVVLEMCQSYLKEGQLVPLSNASKAEIKQVYEDYSERGLRVLSFATKIQSKPFIDSDDVSIEADLTFIGVVGILDPPKENVKPVLEKTARAGIKTIVITGDSAGTAKAVASQVHLDVTTIVTGRELADMDDATLKKLLVGTPLFARMSPDQKYRIVKALQDSNQIVAMTGDGINDTPALKQADVGIAMGIRGTDVAKSAADIVLTDDNFSSIVNAIEEGRRQFSNIQKFILYLLSSNVGEVVAICLNVFFGGPLILLPVQILWMNLITDGMTAVSLGMEPKERNIMEKPPRDIDASILDKKGIFIVLGCGAYIGLCTLGVFNYYLHILGNVATAGMLANTMAFTTIIILEKMNVLNFRSFSEPMYRLGFFTNRWFLIAWVATISLQLCAIYVPFFQLFLHTVPLSLMDWGVILLVSVPMFVVVEFYKVIRKAA